MEEEYGDKIHISWRSYPLALGENPKVRPTPRSVEARRRADLEEENISFRPWDPRRTHPTSSMAALQAAKCAQLQGEQVFRHFHIALFRAFFEESRNIGDRQVLINLAKETGLDVERFSSDFDRGWQENEVLAEYEDGRGKYAGWGIPLAIIGDRYPVVGASPIAMYRRAIDLCLANQAG